MTEEKIMVKSAEDRIEKYKAKIDPYITSIYLKKQEQTMIKKETSYFIKISEIEGKTKALCIIEGIYPFQIANYLFFARELYRITHTFADQTAINEANLALWKWVQRGLDLSLLLKIGKIFSLTLTYYEPPPFELTGDAEKEDVIEDKTFYNTDPKTKLTGIATLNEHQNAEILTNPVQRMGVINYWRTLYTTPSIITSCSITITKKSLITVVAFFIINSATQITQIRRNNTDKTKETNISLINFTADNYYGHVQYATEILDVGTYQYNLYYTASLIKNVLGAIIKIVATSF